MREGDLVELLKVGCAGWWFVRVVGEYLVIKLISMYLKNIYSYFLGSLVEGWAPAAYLENLHRKTSRSTSHSQDRLNVH